MKKFLAVLLFFMIAILSVRLEAQEKSKPDSSERKEQPGKDDAKKDEPKKELIPLRVQVVLSEFEGEKKIISLPYTLPLNAERHGTKASIRMGLRVPITTGNYATTTGLPTTQYQYVDAGTNLDGWADNLEDGRFSLRLIIERSSVYSSVSLQKGASLEIVTTQPVIQQFRSEIYVLLRDGQSTQSTVATDPVSGRVTKVDITLNVVK